MLGPEEFFEGLALGGRQFVGGTVGGLSGVAGKVTGVFSDAAAKLSFDKEFQDERKKNTGTLGEGAEGAVKVGVRGETKGVGVAWSEER